MPCEGKGDSVGKEAEPPRRTGRLPGAYIILFRMVEGRNLTIGRLGTFDVETGWYAYVGSALSGLEARTERHLRADGRRRWHIDHLLPYAVERTALLIPSDMDIECEVAAVVRGLRGTTVPIPGFGSSDCRCVSHLFHLSDETVPHLRSMVSTGLRGRQVIIKAPS